MVLENWKERVNDGVNYSLILVLLLIYYFLEFLIGGLIMKRNTSEQVEITINKFANTHDGQEVLQYTLKNENGLALSVLNFGGIITNLYVPDRKGNFNDIVLGYNRLEDYINNSPFFGALIGRYGNRIANGKFDLDGKEYQLALNDKPGDIPCHLHGGNKGFDKLIWNIEPIMKGDTVSLKLSYRSKDGEEGYPGNLDTTVYYHLRNDNILRIEYYAETDKPTPVNLTQHSYFNFKGEGNGDVLDHKVYINADKFTPVNKGLIPTGAIKSVKDTPFDFSISKMIKSDINADNLQLNYGGGYDHNYVLNDHNRDINHAATVIEPESKRKLEVWTTEPGMQFYSGNNLDESYVGKSGNPYKKYAGLCLETQHYPDSPNQDNFPSTILRPGEKYQSATEFRVSIEED